MNIDKYNFSGFIWSPAKKFTDEILEHINKTFPVLHHYTYDFKNKEDFETSILDIYTTDDIDPNKVKNVKIKNMINHSFFYTYFKFYIEKPNFRKKKATGNNISQSVENIKKEIRTSYMRKVQNYIHDIIIHISDNFEQTKDIDIIMKKYEQNRKYEFINLKYFLKCNYKNNIFDRADMLIRKYSIEQYLKDENYDFSLYKKMQKKRTGRNSENYINTFKKLIKSLLNNGFNINNPIIYSDNYLLLNGSHRLSYCYLKKYNFVPVEKNAYIQHGSYSIEWFKHMKFSQEELNIIQNELKDLNIFNSYL